MDTDADILAEENVRLRDENKHLKARLPKLERRYRYDRFLLILLGIMSFTIGGIARNYWLYEGSRMACPEITKAAPTVSKGCKDAVIPFNSSVECPDSKQTGRYVFRSGAADLFICSCQRTDSSAKE